MKSRRISQLVSVPESSKQKVLLLHPVSPTLLNRDKNVSCQIVDGYLSDHMAVTMAVDPACQGTQKGKGTWKLNASILNDDTSFFH